MTDEELRPRVEAERYEMSSKTHRFELGRRDFFQWLAAGIVVAGVLTYVATDAWAQRREGEPLPDSIGAWLHIGED